jgi:hypothetical protein
MNYNKKLNISEFEHNNILSMYNIAIPKRNYVFEMCATVNGRYFIVQDEVFDIVEQKTLGNIWKSLDNFKEIFQNTIVENQQYNLIRQNISSLPLLEGDRNLYGLRDLLLEFNFFDDTWVGRELKNAGTAIKNTAVDSYEGMKKFGLAVSQGEWSEILNLLAQGVRYILRKLKSALYSNIGMTIDAIILAVSGGSGKVIQWLPWALVTALDVYQLASNDWPEEDVDKPLWAKWMELGFDILGLVFSGVFAKGAKIFFKPLLTAAKSGPKAIASWFARNPKGVKLVESMIGSTGKVSSKLKSAQSILSKKFPKGAQFIASSLGGLNTAIQSMINSLKSLIRGTAKVVTKVTGGTGKTGTAIRTAGTVGGLGYALGGDNRDFNQEFLKLNKKFKPNYSDPSYTSDVDF